MGPVAADGAEDDSFGWSVAVSGEVAVIGAHKDDDAGSKQDNHMCNGIALQSGDSSAHR